jgi:hypothetical protein
VAKGGKFDCDGVAVDQSEAVGPLAVTADKQPLPVRRSDQLRPAGAWRVFDIVKLGDLPPDEAARIRFLKQDELDVVHALVDGKGHGPAVADRQGFDAVRPGYVGEQQA